MTKTQIALRRCGNMPQKRPAAGGESCPQDSVSDVFGRCGVTSPARRPGCYA
ncbi:MAG: hypothetical protein K2H37_01865 [Lachnospiraceae bacterium]|nr:hypothetical protein [Lachnospiraceae bacterium]